MRYLLGERLYRETLLARPLIRSTNVLTLNIPMGYINSSILSWREKLYENTYDITIETSLDNGETWRPQLPGEQIPGLADVSITKPTKLLVHAIVDTTNTINPADITNITLDIDYSAIGHYAICSDGRAYFNGQEIGGEPDFISISNGALKIKGGRKIDELYVTPRLLTKEEIDILHQTQYELQDPKESIDAGFRKISHLSGEIDADGHTIYASIQGQNKIVSHYGIDPNTGDRGLFVYDIDEQGNPVEVGFTGRRGDGTVVGFGEGGGFTPGTDIVTGNITPATDNLSIGTPDNRFYAIYADTLGGIPKDYLNIAKPPIAIQKGDVYFPFENSLYSTQSIKPLAGYVATLLPEGGVSVAEGTTNLCDPAYMYTNTWTTIDYGWNRRTIINCTAGDVFTISADIRNLSQGSNQRWGYVSFHDSGGTALVTHYARDHGMSEQRLSFTTPPAPMGTVEARVYWVSESNEVIYQGKNFQIEKKPYATPFTEGTRPAGILAYHDLAKHFNQREFTFACWWRPYTEKGISSSPYDRFFQIDNGNGTLGNRIQLGRVYKSAGLEFEVPNADGSGSQQYTFTPSPYAVNTWHFIAVVVDVANMKVRIHLNDEYEEFPLTEVPAMLDLQRFFLGCAELVGTISQLNGELKNVLIRPYAVSPETIATWHSLDTSFYDFSENPLVSNSIIVEEGSNENGWYIRWENGLQVCWGGVMVPANAGYSVKTMPAAFRGGFNITITNMYWHRTDIVWSVSSSTGSTVRVDARTFQNAYPTVDAYGRFIAIGRYK